MNIAPISLNNYYQKKIINNPSFTSIGPIFKDYRDVNGKFRSTQITTALRNDLDYKLLAKTIRNEIKSLASKVKIYSLAGADGTEAYAIADAIIGEMGFERAKQNVFPIYVSDINKWVIDEYGKSGKICFNNNEIEKLPNIKDFLIKKGHNDKSGKSTYSLKPELRECFEFETADLQAKINNLPTIKENEFYIFVIRNCLAQAFSSYEWDIILSNLTKKYPENAMVILGGYDLEHMTNMRFIPFDPLMVGLVPIGNNCFRTCR